MFKNLKDFIKDFFYFSNNQANGLCFIVVSIVFFMILPKGYQLYYSAKPLDHRADIILLENNLRLLQDNSSRVACIDINAATIQQLEKLEGISRKLALTIVRYRDRLGGFVSVNQYREVYGLSLSLQQKLRKQTMIASGDIPKKLSLNQAKFKDLIVHPYIPLAMAKRIMNYRKRQGKFTSLEALKELPGYHIDWAKKIMPYLTIE